MKDKHEIKADLYSSIINIVQALVVVLDKQGRIVLFNHAAEELTGYSFYEIRGTCVWEVLILPEEVEGVKQVFSQLTSGSFPNQYTNYWLTKDGQKILIEWNNTAICDDDDIRYIIGTGIDITEKKKAEDEVKQYQANLEKIVEERTKELNKLNAQLEETARFDVTTGVYNRRHFNEVLGQEIRRAKRNNQSLALIMCDVDFFKKYNDFYGHIAGDACLKKVANSLRCAVKRTTDLVARYGGEEFAIILPAMDPAEAHKFSNCIVEQVRKEEIENRASSIAEVVTISAGVACMKAEDLTDISALVNLADKALYQAKEKGRNQSVEYCID